MRKALRTIMSLLMVILMVASMSVSVLATDTAPTDYDISINGVLIKPDNCSNVLDGDNAGKVSYDATKKVLTLNGASLTKGMLSTDKSTMYCIYVGSSNSDLTIQLGDSTTTIDSNTTDTSVALNLLTTYYGIYAPDTDVVISQSSNTSSNSCLQILENLSISNSIGIYAKNITVKSSVSIKDSSASSFASRTGVKLNSSGANSGNVTIDSYGKLKIDFSGPVSNSSYGIESANTVSVAGNLDISSGATTSGDNIAINANSIDLSGSADVSIIGKGAAKGGLVALKAKSSATPVLSVSKGSCFTTESTVPAIADKKDVTLTLGNNYKMLCGSSSENCEEVADLSNGGAYFKRYNYIKIYRKPIVINVSKSQISADETSVASVDAVPSVSGYSLTWTCSEPDCAVIDDKSNPNILIITGKVPGSVTITAVSTDKLYSDTKTVEILAPVPTTTISFDTTSMYVGDTATYTVTNLPSGCKVSVTGNPSGCIDTPTDDGNPTGTFKAVKPGTATVAVMNGTSKVAEQSISFDDPFEINFDPLMYVGDYCNASISGSQTVTWSSSNTAVATIGASDGKIAALKVGTTTITAKTNDNKYSVTAILTVSERPSISTSQSTYYLKLSGSEQIPVTVTPAGSKVNVVNTDTSATYVSATYTQASSTAPGNLVLRGVSPISTPITIELSLEDYPNVTKTLQVYVNDLSNVKMTRVSSSAISFTSLTGSKMAQVALTPETDYAKSHIIWTSDNTSVAQVSKDTTNAQIAAVIPKANGTTKITAKLVDNVSNPSNVYQSVSFDVTVSSATNYTYTYPAGTNKLVWYYDSTSHLQYKTNIPADIIKQYGVQIFYSSTKYYDIPAAQFSVTTESSTGYSIVTINKDYLYKTLPHSKTKYTMNTFYGTNLCITKPLYVQSVKDTPPTGDQNMSLYAAMLVISGLICAIIPTTYFVKKKVFTQKTDK